MYSEGEPVTQIAVELGARPDAVGGWVARQLHEEGKGVAKIARELGVAAAKVKGWLEGGTREK